MTTRPEDRAGDPIDGPDDEDVPVEATPEERQAAAVNAMDEIAAEAAESAEPLAATTEPTTSITLPTRTVEDADEAAPKARRAAADDDDGYDPGADTVDDVLAYVDKHPDEADRVLAAEKAGKNRTTVVSQLEAR
jgi:hypothetical protein